MILTMVLLAVANLVLPSSVRNVPNPLVGIMVTIGPPLAWVVLLYRERLRGNLELSPLIPIFLLIGVLFAAAVTHPLIVNTLDLEMWLSRTNAFNRFLGNILLNGFFHFFILYTMIRYLAWNHPSFAHRIDGIIFVLAAGFGYAATLNLYYVIDHGGLAILNGGLRVLSMLCAFVTPCLILGYFVGQNRFEDLPPYFLSVGLVLSAVLNGLLLYAGSELNYIGLSLSQSGFSPWPGFVLNLLALAAVFFVTSGLVRRQNALVKGRLEPGA